jgi:hypothetical protein
VGKGCSAAMVCLQATRVEKHSRCTLTFQMPKKRQETGQTQLLRSNNLQQQKWTRLAWRTAGR